MRSAFQNSATSASAFCLLTTSTGDTGLDGVRGPGVLSEWTVSEVGGGRSISVE